MNMKYPAFSSVQAELFHVTHDMLYTYKGEMITISSSGVNAFSRYENGKTKPPLARWLSCSRSSTIILIC